MNKEELDEIIRIAKLEGLVRDVTKTKYRYVYVLEEDYINCEGRTVHDLDLEGQEIYAEDIIGILTRGLSIFNWNNEKYDPVKDLILPNYKGIRDCIASGN